MPSSKRPGPAPTENAIAVPHTELQPETLRNLVEEFVTRDGTDYGAVEKDLEEKVAGVMRELETGEAVIYFDTESESVHIVAPRRVR